jgi:hypothetical protein
VKTLYDDLLCDGASAVHALRGRSEELDFDCKRKKTPTNGSFEAEDWQNLGKALSAFANSMRGLLLWGVDARKDQSSGIDVVCDFDPITDVRRFESEARTLSSEALMPRISQHRHCSNRGTAGLRQWVLGNVRRPFGTASSSLRNQGRKGILSQIDEFV